MDLAFSDLVAPITDLADADALQCWRWLAGAEAKPLLLTSLGDLFVTLREGSVAFLDTYEGTLRTVSADRASWKLALQDEENLHAWFTPGLVRALRERGLSLSAGQCYSPIHPPVLGGTMEPDNFEMTHWLVHLGIMGQLHEQTKDLPPGTPITGVKAK